MTGPSDQQKQLDGDWLVTLCSRTHHALSNAERGDELFSVLPDELASASATRLVWTGTVHRVDADRLALSGDEGDSGGRVFRLRGISAGHGDDEAAGETEAGTRARRDPLETPAWHRTSDVAAVERVLERKKVHVETMPERDWSPAAFERRYRHAVEGDECDSGSSKKDTLTRITMSVFPEQLGQTDSVSGGESDSASNDETDRALTDPFGCGVVGLVVEGVPGDDQSQFRGGLASVRALLVHGLRATRRDHNLGRERERLEALRSAVSHDFGSTLNLASGRVELASDECDSPHLEHAQDALATLEERIDTELRYVRAGFPVRDASVVSVASLARECWETVTTEFETDSERTDSTASPTLDVRTPDTDSEGASGLVVAGEPERIRMLLHELFRNALDHGGTDVRVTVGALDQSGFYVEDTGPGIPADEREYVFERGYTSDPNREGVGLALVAEIAGAHGWRLELRDGETGGTRVNVVT